MTGAIRRVAIVAAIVGAWVLAATGEAGAADSILHLRPGATDAATAARIQAVNDQWQAANPDATPERKQEFRPRGSDLLWIYYRRQGFFPNWVAAARDLLRRDRAGETTGVRRGVDEIVSYSHRRTAPDGTVFRINESPYLSTDSTAPPWRDAMGQGLILTTLATTLHDQSTPRERERIRGLATEYLNSFAVDWRDGGVATDGKAGGNWYLEYATPRGDASRVLNGFMQSIASLDRFASQADVLAKDDPQWAELRDRAREYVRLAALEVDAHLDDYDLGGGISRYSMRSTDPAPPVYQVFHRQLLQRLQQIGYLPREWRDHFDRVRMSWGGPDLTPPRPWWHWGLVGLWAVAIALVALRLRARARRRRSRPGRSVSS